MNTDEAIIFNRISGQPIDLLLSRRSTLARNIDEPGPSETQLSQILAAAARVPDHGKLAPWRFLVLGKSAQTKLGHVIGTSLQRETPDLNEMTLKNLRQFPTQAPILITVVSHPVPDCKIPIWEQHLSAGAACQNILAASASLGLAAQWLTGRAAYCDGVRQHLGLAEHDQIAGFIFLGTPSQQELKERPRPNLNDVVRRL